MRFRIRFDRGNIRTWLIVAGCLVARPETVTLVIGWLLIVPGAWLHLWAKGCLQQNREVTSSGPYRWTRNPFYLGNFVIDAGLGIVINQPWLWVVFLPLWFLVYRREILQEEKHLEELFGDQYRQYKALVPRFWPWRGRARNVFATEEFSWQNPNLAWGSEYARLLRMFTAPLLIAMCRLAWQYRWGILTGSHSLASAGLVLLGVLTILEWCISRRFRRTRQLVPSGLQSQWFRALVLTAFAVLAYVTAFLKTDLDQVVWPVGLGVCLLAFVLLAWPKSSALSPAMIRWGEAASCLVGGCLAEVPWLGLLGFGYFGVLAIDATRVLSVLVLPGELADDDRSLPAQRVVVLVVMVLFVVLGFVKHVNTTGAWPLASVL